MVVAVAVILTFATYALAATATCGAGVGSSCSQIAPATAFPGYRKPWKVVDSIAWTEGGLPVVYFLGATWSGYSDGNSWIVWKALDEFGSVSGFSVRYSYPADVYPNLPGVGLSNATLTGSPLALAVSEYDGDHPGSLPSLPLCGAAEYFAAFGQGGTIPFVAIGGEWVVSGSMLDTFSMDAFANASSSGAASIASDLLNETGTVWTILQNPVWWMMAMFAEVTGQAVPELAATFHWSSADVLHVSADAGLLG